MDVILHEAQSTMKEYIEIGNHARNSYQNCYLTSYIFVITVMCVDTIGSPYVYHTYYYIIVLINCVTTEIMTLR